MSEISISDIIQTEPDGESPYPSWIWVTNEVGVGFWSPPIPHPANLHNKPLIWNESEQSWYYKDEESGSFVKHIN